MLTRKPVVLLHTVANITAVPTSAYGSSTSSSRQRRSTRQRKCPVQKQRLYATIAGEHTEHHDNTHGPAHSWPKPPEGQTHPTPYQIFAIKTNATYSKARYYELVKLYHPDRISSVSDDLPPSVKLERYRLIVAAHGILSDPAKRSAYDRFGAGWNGRAEVGGRQTYHQGHPAGPFSRSWHDPGDPIWQNATWEDWERYYEWRARNEGTFRSRPRQAPVYFRNSYFIALVAMLAMIGSTANSKRAHDAGSYFLEQRDIVHDRTARELRRVREDATSSGSRQDRIDWFLRNREATLGLSGSDLEALRQEKAERVLPEREMCNSEEIVDKGG